MEINGKNFPEKNSNPFSLPIKALGISLVLGAIFTLSFKAFNEGKNKALEENQKYIEMGMAAESYIKACEAELPRNQFCEVWARVKP